jgi:hypothetical protein
MIPKECKRLAEVDFPIAEVSKHSAREKSIRHGHPSTLHLWWARRPLAACRAVLLALLLPDPGEERCPAEFKKKAREQLAKLPGRLGPKDEDLRRALLKFIGDFANCDLAANKTYLEAARGLVKAAYGYTDTARRSPTARSTCGSEPLAERSRWGRSRPMGCEFYSIRLGKICGKSRSSSATRISARPCAIPMSAMNRHGRRRKRSVTLWSENAAARTTHPAHNNEYYCTPSVPLINPSTNAQKDDIYPVARLLAGWER